MNPMIILGLIQAGGAIARQFIDKPSALKYLDLGMAAAAGANDAIEIQAQVETWVATKHTPTKEEVAALVKRSGEVHASLQAKIAAQTGQTPQPGNPLAKP